MSVYSTSSSGSHHHHHHGTHRSHSGSHSHNYREAPLPAGGPAVPYGSPAYGSGYPVSDRAIVSRAPPAGADPQLWKWFDAVNTHHSGAITVQELQNALVNGDWTKFDLDTVKMLMNMFDTDRSGTISFSEFCGLWKYIEDWQNVFRHFDRDRSGSIEGYELAEVLRSFGYNLSPSILTLIEQKYASAPTAGYGPPPGITFDRFVRACVVVKSLTEAFQRADTDRDGYVQLSYEEFLKIILRAP